jgi:outer membrane protein assembly factor BamB
MRHGKIAPRFVLWTLAFLLVAVAPLAPLRSMAVGLQQPVWKTTIDGLSSSVDEATWVAVDGSGDVFAAGLVFDLIDGPSFLVVKLSGSTGTEIWSESLGTGVGLALAVDGAGDVIAAGTLVSGLYSDFVVVKLAGSDGNEEWRATIDGSGGEGDQALSVAVDNAGDVFAVGFLTGSGSGSDFFVVKLEGSTGDQIWRGTVDGTASDVDEGVHITIDGSGDVIAAGLLTNSGTDQDFAVVKYLPEPSQWLLLVSGVLGLALLHRLDPRCVLAERRHASRRDGA